MVIWQPAVDLMPLTALLCTLMQHAACSLLITAAAARLAVPTAPYMHCQYH